MNSLTANLGATTINLSYLWVHLDQEVALVRELLVPRPDVDVDPVLERLSTPCVDHIRKPLTRQQVDLSLVRQIQHEIGKLLGFLEHASYTDSLVLRAGD